MIQVGFKTSTGLLRDNNEDAFFVVPSDNVYIIADGVGGNNAGELASRTAVTGVAQCVKDAPVRECRTDEEICDYFSRCLSRTNEEIFALADRYEENRGMATTIVISYIRGRTAYFVNVGDSRAYVYRKGFLSQVTEDHTYVNTLIRKGELSEEDAKSHTHRNVITRALGAEEQVEPDFFKTELKENDIILLCTDGLYSDVKREEIEEILGSGESMSDVSRALIDKANECGGNDNITVIVLKITGGDNEQ